MGGNAVVTSLFALDFEAQKMSRAGDARIVIAHRLLATPSQLLLRQIEEPGHELTKIGLNALLILRCRRDDLRVGDQTILVNPVSMIEQSARRFGGAVANARPRDDFDRRPI